MLRLFLLLLLYSKVFVHTLRAYADFVPTPEVNNAGIGIGKTVLEVKRSGVGFA